MRPLLCNSLRCSSSARGERSRFARAAAPAFCPLALAARSRRLSLARSSRASSRLNASRAGARPEETPDRAHFNLKTSTRIIMRVLILAAAMALVAQPAFAHHKPNHRDFVSRAEASAAAPDACAARRHRHRQAGSQQALAQHCRELREALRAAPGDEGLRARCDQAAHALSGRPCED